MTRRVKTYVVPSDDPRNRDKTKTFVITEMSAFDGEDWAIRALRLAQKSGVNVPGGLNAGMQGVAAVGILALLEGSDDIDEVRELLREMMACVKIMTDQKTMFTRPLVERDKDDDNNDIQEISTRVILRREWLNLHLDFTLADALSELVAKPPGTTSAI